jgi:hypothetical protein
MSELPEKPQKNQRSIEVTRSMVERGRGATRSMWVKIAPKNPFLKIALGIPIVVVGIALIILILIILGFTVLALVLIGTVTGGGKSISKRISGLFKRLGGRRDIVS